MSAPHPALLDLVAGREPASVADERRLLESAVEHRLVSLVLRAHEQGLLHLSTDGETDLAIRELAQQQIHHQLWQALAAIEEVLAGLGVDVAVLKGIATEACWYDGVGERTYTDLDLLLDPGVLDDVTDVVVALDPERGDTPAISELTRKRLLQHVDLRFGRVPVDLHFDPLKLGVPTRSLDSVWQSTIRVDTPHGSIRVVAPEVELVLLLLHLNKDGFALLGPFLDIARLVDRAALDWDRVREFVRSEGLDVPVWKSLELVSRTVGIDLDHEHITGPRAWSWERVWGGRALAGVPDAPTRVSAQPLLPFHARGRVADNVREVRRQLLPHRALLEVAGRIRPGDSYLRYVAIDRLRSEPAVSGEW